MSVLIGREKEIALLKEALYSNKPELITIYGRRRVGKTFLVRQFFKTHIQFECTGLHNGTLEDQLKNFAMVFSQKVKGKNKIVKPKDWLDAFNLLENYIDQLTSKRKKVIFIDEFPWFATPRSKFLMAFENFWNSYASKKNDLVIVICGSAASFMIQKIIKNKGGLHNRITQKIRLLPFNLSETELFIKKSKKIPFSRYDILQLYMALGGIPYYLEKLKKGESVAQALDRLCFEKDGFLTDEFNLIFASLFNNYERHESIIKALSKVRKGLTRNDLSKKSKIPTGGTFTKTIQELIESGFVSQYLPFGKKSKDSLYRLTDEYSMFYLKFMNKKECGAGTWKKLFNSRSYLSWSGFSFETVCFKHLEQIKTGLGISSIYSRNASWIEKNSENGAQIDLLIDRDDNIINLCEMKFSDSIFTITKKYSEEIKNKLSTFKTSTQTRKSLFIVMITTYEVKQNSYSLENVDNNLTMDCLFEK